MKVMSAQEAVKLINNSDTVTIGGLPGLLCPEKVLEALEQRYIQEKEPRGLTLFCPVRPGGSAERREGLEHFGHEGFLTKLISGSFQVKDSPHLARLVQENKIATYSFPMGTMFHLLREIGAGGFGIVTKVGLNTFVDPRIDGGRINASAEENLVELIKLKNEEYLFYKSMPINVAIIRGTTADEDGNISMEREGNSLGMRVMAMAAHNSGGKVIAQVQRITQRGTIHPRMVEVPGVFVDVVVVDENQKQNSGKYEPGITGEIREPLSSFQPLPFDKNKIVIRRAAMELRKGNVVNLGVGMGANIPLLSIEEGFYQDLTFSVEHGAIGGVPSGEARLFATHFNPEAIIDSSTLFGFYHGGGLNATVLGFAQIDEKGNVNVSNFNGLFRGPGGFIDITHKTKKIVFCGTFTAGGLEVQVQDGRLQILQEGRHKKFLRKVDQITLNGQSALAKGQEVFYVTERAVFRLMEEGITLVEVAPGIDICKDILPNMEFRINVPEKVKTMDSRIFMPEPMKIMLE